MKSVSFFKACFLASDVGIHVLQEFHVVGLEGIRHIRNVCVTRWMYRTETTKLEAEFKETSSKEFLCHMPDKGELVFYSKKGHLIHLETFPRESF